MIIPSGTDFFDPRYSIPPNFSVPSTGGIRKSTISWRLPKTPDDLYVEPLKHIDSAVQRDVQMKQKPCAEMLNLLAQPRPKIKEKYMGIKPPIGGFRHQPMNGIMSSDIHVTNFAIQGAPDIFHHGATSRIPVPN